MAEKIETDIGKMIQSSPIWRCKDDILQSVPGIGPVTSASLICDLPELGVLSSKKIAMLVGLAPLNCDSGKFKGRRRIWGGRASVRSGLYMANRMKTMEHIPKIVVGRFDILYKILLGNAIPGSAVEYIK